uniref:Uncharacterized protein n=1 Tax=Anopheles dirus TaxID=7168 RepID=A0A182N3V0_9DIPT
MPYALVEITDLTDCKELVAAPDPWIQYKNGNIPYLRWPSYRNIGHLNALVADELSVPAAAWEEQQCEIVQRNITSLQSAFKLMERERMRGRLNTVTPEVVAVTVPEKVSAKLCSQDEHLHELLASMDREDEEDPLAEDVKPFPELKDLIHELKSLVENSQLTVMKELQEGMPYVLVEAWVSPGYKELVATPDTWIQWRNENTPYLRWPNHRNMQKLNALLADERSVPEAAMPYVLVETMDALGNRELLAAPEAWIQSDEGEISYLCWPNTKAAGKIDALLADEYSVPSVVWERHEMPYILVRITDDVGNRDIIAVPSNWVLRKEDGVTYLCWPSPKSMKTLSDMLADEYSIPWIGWEKHKCDVLYRNIASLETANKQIETIQRLADASASKLTTRQISFPANATVAAQHLQRSLSR